MKFLLALMMCFVAGWCWADPPPAINFNLVQVNHYYTAPQDTGKTPAPAQRVVVDVGAPQMLQQFRQQALNSKINVAPITVEIQSNVTEKNGGHVLPWESHTILKSASGTDSFFVSSSRTGCPGTEVRPSVAVAFRNGGGWSDPPIRFGPLGERTYCPLGKGYGLEVSVVGNSAPIVRLKNSDQYSTRR